MAFWLPDCHPRFKLAAPPKLVSGKPDERYESCVACKVTVDVTAPASLIVLPDDSRECLAALLAEFYLKRLVDDPQYRVTKRTVELYREDAATERQRFLRWSIWSTRGWDCGRFLHRAFGHALLAPLHPS